MADDVLAPYVARQNISSHDIDYAEYVGAGFSNGVTSFLH